MLGNVGSPGLRAQAKAGKCPGRERVEEFHPTGIRFECV
jgi:hypothetical protein